MHPTTPPTILGAVAVAALLITSARLEGASVALSDALTWGTLAAPAVAALALALAWWPRRGES